MKPSFSIWFVLLIVINILSLPPFVFSQEERANIDAGQVLKQADTYMESENYLRAAELYKQSLDLPNVLNDGLQKGDVYMKLGVLYSKISSFQQSADYFFKALRIFDELNNQELSTKVRLELGTLYFKVENFQQSFKFLFGALDYLKTKNDHPMLKDAYIYLGAVYGSINKLDSALYYFYQAEEILVDSKDTIVLGGLYNNIGAVYAKMEKDSSARANYLRSLDLFTSINNQLGRGVSLFNVAMLERSQNNIKESIELIKQSIDLFSRVNSLKNLNECYTHMFQMYDSLGNKDEAIHYYRLYVEINDSIISSDILGKMADIEHQYNLEKLDNEMLLLKSEKKLLQRDNEIKETRQYLLIALLVFLFVTALLIVLGLRTRVKNSRLKGIILKQEKDKLKQDLDFKNKELESFAIHIVEKNEFLEKVKSEIKTIKNQGGGEKISELNLSVNQFLQLDKDKKEFQLYLDEHHQSFLSKLKSRFPDLSENEKRLCSMLVIDLSSKDIATILNITPESVKKNRYRLRKKLNLETDDNLNDFLKSL